MLQIPHELAPKHSQAFRVINTRASRLLADSMGGVGRGEGSVVVVIRRD